MRFLVLHIFECATIQSMLAVPEDVDEMSDSDNDETARDDSISGQFYNSFKLHAAQMPEAMSYVPAKAVVDVLESFRPPKLQDSPTKSMADSNWKGNRSIQFHYHSSANHSSSSVWYTRTKLRCC